MRGWRPTFARILRRLERSAESFGAAAAVYGPDLMLVLAATPSAVEEEPAPARDS